MQRLYSNATAAAAGKTEFTLNIWDLPFVKVKITLLKQSATMIFVFLSTINCS